MSAPTVEFRDPASLPEASFFVHPVDLIEPQLNPIEQLEHAADLLRDVLLDLAGDERSHEAPDLVSIGKRAIAIVHALAPHRISALPGDCDPYSIAEGDSGALSVAAWPLWEWLANASPARYSAFGLRALVLLYVVRNDLISGMTLEDIGDLDGSSRQAMDKLVTDLRDTLGGAIRSRTMKSEETRSRCQRTQLTKGIIWNE